MPSPTRREFRRHLRAYLAHHVTEDLDAERWGSEAAWLLEHEGVLAVRTSSRGASFPVAHGARRARSSSRMEKTVRKSAQRRSGTTKAQQPRRAAKRKEAVRKVGAARGRITGKTRKQQLCEQAPMA